MPGARQLALADDGTVYVGTRGQGKVYAVKPDRNGQRADSVHTLLENLNEPNGVAFHAGALYVAEIHQVQRYAKPGVKLAPEATAVLLHEGFPDRRWHGYKVLKMSPDGWLYTAVGMPCNTCDYRESEPLFGTPATDAPGWTRLTDLRHWHPQQCRFRLAPDDRGIMVLGQWPGLDGR